MNEQRLCSALMCGFTNIPHSPEDCPARPIRSPFTFRPRATTKRIIIHESHTGPEVLRAVDYLRAQGRRNGLLEVGYHTVIERDGTWTTTRPFDRMGSHSAGCNHDSIGVCLAGNDDWSAVAEEMLRLRGRLITLKAAYAHLSDIYGYLPVFGHDEVVRRKPTPDHPTKCPSINMDWLRSYLKGD